MVEPKGPKKPHSTDQYDVAILAGFTALVAGIWWLAPPWALIIGGVLAGAYGLTGSYRKGMGGD